MRGRRFYILATILAAVQMMIAGSLSSSREAHGEPYDVVLATAPAQGWRPVAAVRCDRDRDGDADLVVAYADREGGALVWFPVHGSVIGDGEPPQLLDFPPSSLVAGDLDADGLDELALGVRDAPLLVVLEIDAAGGVTSVDRLDLPGVASSLALEDRPRRDGLPGLVIGLEDRLLVAAGSRGALAALSTPVVEKPKRADRQPNGKNEPLVLLKTRIDADALPELIVAERDGSLWVKTGPKATVQVTTTDDSLDFTGAQQIADLPGPDGKVSLREAIIAANNSPPGPHTINFDIPDTEAGWDGTVWWITPTDGNLGPLPVISTTGVTIDGYTQTFNRGDTNVDGPELVLDGSGLSSGHGIEFAADDCAVIDLNIRSFPNAGVLGAAADNLVVAGCYVGTNFDGTAAAGNSSWGVELTDGTSGAVIGGTGTHGSAPVVADRNLISGNGNAGVYIGQVDTSGNTVLGNIIGADRNETSAIPNGWHGIIIEDVADSNTIGGTAAGAGNLISGNGAAGVEIRDSGTDGTLIQGNLIGTDGSGLVPIGNSSGGIIVDSGASGTTIGGSTAAARNIISGNNADGVLVQDPGTDGTIVQGNWIGLDSTGSAALANQMSGISICNGATNTRIGGDSGSEGNVISGNVYQGIAVWGPDTTGVVIEGNLIGLDTGGSTAVGNESGGISLFDGGGGPVYGAVIGGTSPGAGNVVSGNLNDGISIISGSFNNLVVGNFIGTDSTGISAVPNTSKGVVIATGSYSNTIGGWGPDDGNVISGNGWSGVFIGDNGSDFNEVIGNLIGLDSGGESCLGNGTNGVYVENCPSNSQIDGNWIGCNVYGVWLQTCVANTQIRDNTIGVSVSGAAAVGNDFGIHVNGDAWDTLIGGPGNGNEIANSTWAGIVVQDSAVNATISQNSIHDNGDLGIDLGNDGPTPNDAGDGDGGPNNLVNFPELTSAVNVCGGGSTTVTGTVDTPIPNTGVVELFVSEAADPSGFGEGRDFFGDVVPNGDGSFSIVLPDQPLGWVINATYTDAAGSTSEFSAAATVVTSPQAPSGLQATLVAGPAADLAWTDNANDEDYFLLERRAAGDPEFSFLANLGADVLSYHDAGPLTAGVTYYYRLRAHGGGCTSEWSNESTVTVPGATSAFCRRRLTHHLNALNAYVEYGDGFFGATWRECAGGTCTLVYAKLDASGTILEGPVEVAPWGDDSTGSQLVWNGAEWGHLWFERLADDWGLFFQRLDSSGNPLSGLVRLNLSTGLRLPANNRNRGLAWDGSGWGCVWRGDVADTSHIYYSHVDPNGDVDVGEVMLGDSPEWEIEPMLAFTGPDYGVVWYDRADDQFHLRRFSPDGTPTGPSTQVTTSVQYSFMPDLVWNGGEYGLTWIDSRDDDEAIYFTRLAEDGTMLSPETRLSDPFIPDTLYMQCYDPVLRFTGDRWVVASEDYRNTDPNGEIQYSFADLAGAKLGPDVIVSGPPDGVFGDYPALAWNGANLLALWMEPVGPDALEIHAQATDSVGDPGGNPRRVLTSGHSPGQAVNRAANLAMTGAGWAVAWQDGRSGISYDPYLMLVDGDGVPLTGEIQVADTYPVNSYSYFGPAVAFSGEVIAVAWGRNYSEIYLSLFDSSGSKIGGDLLLSDSSRISVDLIWTGEAFLAAWADNRSGMGWEIYTAAVAADGNVLAPANRISTAGGSGRYPSLAGDGAGRAVAWIDIRDGNWEIYSASLGPFGARVGAERRVTNEPNMQHRPRLAWSGTEFLLVWQDYDHPVVNAIHAVRLDADGAPLAAETVVSDDRGTYPRAAWGDGVWGVVFAGPGGVTYAELDASGVKIGPDRLIFSGIFGVPAYDGTRFVFTALRGMYWNHELYLSSLPCALDDTPPACPSDLDADPVGGSVTLSWTPGTDDDFAVDWQVITRDGARIAVVEPGVAGWVDPIVPEGAHDYTVATLNQGGLESPGCAGLSVYASASCIGVRSMQPNYMVDVPVPVNIDVGPPGASSVYAVEETPPSGWTVTDISDGGIWDAVNQQVKWIFFDNTPRNLSYNATPPPGTSGPQTFAGVVSVDGGDQTLCGVTVIESGPPHPADLDDDWNLVINEVTGYGAAWRTGAPWPRPPDPILIEYVTNASFLWMVGGVYHYDMDLYPPYTPGVRVTTSGAGQAWSVFSDMAYSAGVPFTVTIQVDPLPTSFTYAVEDLPPTGWTVSGISDGGAFDIVSGKVKWGPFLDNASRTLTYTVTPDSGSGLRTFTGTVSFDGVNFPVLGARAISDVAGDVNGDGTLETLDLLALLEEIFATTATWPNPDINKDGHIDAGDVSSEVVLLTD
jgi:hypothetical protein